MKFLSFLLELFIRKAIEYWKDRIVTKRKAEEIAGEDDAKTRANSISDLMD